MKSARPTGPPWNKRSERVITGTRRGIGVDSRIGAQRVVALAQLAEELHYASLWFNVIGAERDPVDLLERVVGQTEHIDIGVGAGPTRWCCR